MLVYQTDADMVAVYQVVRRDKAGAVLPCYVLFLITATIARREHDLAADTLS